MPRVWRLRSSTCTPAGSSTGVCWVTTCMHNSYCEVFISFDEGSHITEA